MWYLINLIISGLITVLITCIFWFWFIYLLKAILQKRKIYRSALRCIEHGDYGSQEKMVIYNAETQLVKNIFLFFMNIVEWLAFFYNSIIYFYEVYQSHIHCSIESNKNNTEQIHDHLRIPCFLTTTEMRYDSYLFSSFLFVGDNLIVLSLVLIACLCEYLAARFSQVSWIKSRNKLTFFTIFVVYLIVIQIISLFCSIVIIAKWFNTLLLTISFILAVRQYKKLNLVINWTIMDLKISNVNKKLLRKIIAQKKAFNCVFRFIWIGTLVMLGIEYFRNIVMVAKIVLNNSNSLNFDISLCYSQYDTNPIISDLLAISLVLDNIFSTAGFIIYFIPYIGIGITSMYVKIWRLAKGIPRFKMRFRI